MKRVIVVMLIPVLLALLTPAGTVCAQNPEMAAKMASAAKEAFKKILLEADKNQDAKLSRNEVYAMFKDKEQAEKNFKAWDLNQDGIITEEEYVKAVVNIGRNRKK